MSSVPQELALYKRQKLEGNPTPQDYLVSVPMHQQQREEITGNTNTNTNSSLNHRRQTNQIPIGYKFSPTDDELILHYLKKKINNESLSNNNIPAVDIYTCTPDFLADQYPAIGERDWYFFTPRTRKDKNGGRPSRTAGDGYWKATSGDKPVKHKNKVIGFKKALVFYLGKPPNGTKTNWLMQEYVAQGPPRSRNGEEDMRLDDCVLCRIYKNNSKKVEQQKQHELMAHSAAASLDDESIPRATENACDDPTLQNCDPNTFRNYIQLPFLNPEIPQTSAYSYLQNFDTCGAYHHQPILDIIEVPMSPLLDIQDSELKELEEFLPQLDNFLSELEEDEEQMKRMGGAIS